MPESSAPHVAVLGGGVAGLTAAYTCAAAGAAATVVEAAARAGGCVAAREVGGVRIDLGAESFATRGGAVAELAERLGLAAKVVVPDPAGAWLRTGGRDVPLPRGGLFGIPADLEAPDVVAALGRETAARAAARDAAPVAANPARSLAGLVRERLGEEVLRLLVAPVVGGVYSASPDELDVDVLAPGLREALVSTGSLTAAVRAQGPPTSRAGSAVLGLAGGMSGLVDALAAAVGEHGGRLLHGARATGIRRAPTDGWLVERAGAAPLVADAVVVALPGRDARRLLARLSPALHEACSTGESPWPDAAAVDIAALVVDATALDDAPRGTGMLVAAEPGGVRAKALTHATAKWRWLAEAAGPHRHVLRLSYGHGTAPENEGALRARVDAGALRARVDAGALRAQALADAAALTGIALTGESVRGFAHARWHAEPPTAVFGQPERIAAVRAAAAAEPGLAVAGTWLNGTGLASVVPGAQQAAAAILGTFSNP